MAVKKVKTEGKHGMTQRKGRKPVDSRFTHKVERKGLKETENINVACEQTIMTVKDKSFYLTN